MLIDASGNEVKQPTLEKQARELVADILDLSERNKEAGKAASNASSREYYEGKAAAMELCAGELERLLNKRTVTDGDATEKTRNATD